MYSVEAVGRLVLIRIENPMSPDDVARFVQKTRTTLMTSTGRIVGVADIRGWSIMAPDSADMIATMFVRDNPRIERTAILVPASDGGLRMQMTRLVRDSKTQSRRLFDAPGPAVDFLRELLRPDELRALEAFVAPR